MGETDVVPASVRLQQAGWLFAAGSAVHLVDHLRRGQGSVSEAVYVLGNIGIVVQIVIVVLLVTQHKRGPDWAAWFGYPLALGFVAVHWLPHWSVLSDPIWEITSLQPLSWFASSSEILGALAVATLSVAALRERRVGPRGQREVTAQE